MSKPKVKPIQSQPHATQAYILAELTRARAEGLPWREITWLGYGTSTLLAFWKKAEAAGGQLPPPPRKGGRPPVVTPTAEDFALTRRYRLEKESIPVAAEMALYDERISQPVRDEISRVLERAIEMRKRPSWPDSLRGLFAASVSERAAHQGSKAVINAEMVSYRGMCWEDADLTRHPILPGQLMEMDDYSTNQPYVWSDPDTAEERLGRQILAARDVCSGAWQAFDCIGRERDAYRGEDIVRFIERTMDDRGVPQALRLERGIWESSWVHGLKVDGLAEPWGDLRQLCTILHVYKSKGKGSIEGGFRMLQRLLSHTGTDIGRWRGQFELAQKKWAAAKRGSRSALAMGFLPQDEALHAHLAAAKWMNSRQAYRRHLNQQVSAEELIERHGWHGLAIPDSLRWLFLPFKERRIVRGGHVEVRPGGGWAPICYRVNGVEPDLHLENGYPVLIAYDPARPDRGAYIANACTDRAANRKGWSLGEVILPSAPFAELAPQYSLATQLSPELRARKAAAATARTSFAKVRDAGRTIAHIEKQGGVRLVTNQHWTTLPQPSGSAAAAPSPAETPVPVPAPRRGGIAPTTVSRMPADPAARRAHLARLRAEAEADAALF